MKKVNVSSWMRYSNHSLKDNAIINLCLKSQYSQLSKTVLCSQLLNEDVSIKAKFKKSVMSLGNFRIKRLIIDGDGESKILLTSSSEFVELNNLNKIAIESEMEEFEVMFSANISA